MATIVSKEIGFYLDNKKRSPRNWNESDAKAVPVLFATGNAGLENSVFGFSSEAAFESWLAKSGLGIENAKAKALLARSPQTFTQAQENEVSALQARGAEEHARKLSQLLRDARISPDNPEAVQELIANYNPLAGPPVHSALLHEHINSQGQWRILPGGWVWPKLSWLGFNDVCSSVTCFMGGIHLFEHTFFKGRRIGMFAYPGAKWNIHGYPFYFNDMASSAITW